MFIGVLTDDPVDCDLQGEWDLAPTQQVLHVRVLVSVGVKEDDVVGEVKVEESHVLLLVLEICVHQEDSLPLVQVVSVDTVHACIVLMSEAGYSIRLEESSEDADHAQILGTQDELLLLLGEPVDKVVENDEFAGHELVFDYRLLLALKRLNEAIHLLIHKVETSADSVHLVIDVNQLLQVFLRYSLLRLQLLDQLKVSQVELSTVELLWNGHLSKYFDHIEVVIDQEEVIRLLSADHLL